MENLAPSLSGVIWEKCVKLEKCIRIPITNQKICVSVGACIRVIDRGGQILLQVEAGGRQFEFPLSKACHKIFSVGVGYIELCIEPRGGKGIRLQARACLQVGPIGDCWDIWGADVHWLTAAEFDALNLSGHRALEGEAASGYVALVDEFQPVPAKAGCDCRD